MSVTTTYGLSACNLGCEDIAIGVCLPWGTLKRQLRLRLRLQCVAATVIFLKLIGCCGATAAVETPNGRIRRRVPANVGSKTCDVNQSGKVKFFGMRVWLAIFACAALFSFLVKYKTKFLLHNSSAIQLASNREIGELGCLAEHTPASRLYSTAQRWC